MEKRKINCKFFQKTEKITDEKYIKNVKEYQCVFFKHFLVGFVLVVFLTFILSYFNWISSSRQIVVSSKIFEIVATIIGFLGILLGFILTALGVIISGVQNRFHNEQEGKKKGDLNLYWEYLVQTSKYIIFLLLYYILFFIICLSQVETILNLHGDIYLISWSILSTILICLLVFDRIFDFWTH